MVFKWTVSTNGHSYKIQVDDRGISIYGEGKVYSLAYNFKSYELNAIEKGLRRFWHYYYVIVVNDDSLSLTIKHTLLDLETLVYKIPLTFDKKLDSEVKSNSSESNSSESKKVVYPTTVYLRPDRLGPSYSHNCYYGKYYNYAEHYQQNVVQKIKLHRIGESVDKHIADFDGLNDTIIYKYSPSVTPDYSIGFNNRKMYFAKIEARISLDFVGIFTFYKNRVDISCSIVMDPSVIYTYDIEAQQWTTTVDKFNKDGWLCKVNMPNGLYKCTEGMSVKIQDEKLYLLYNMNVTNEKVTIIGQLEPEYIHIIM